MTTATPLPPSASSTPGAKPAAIAALGLAASTLLTWYRVELGRLGEVIPIDAGFGREASAALGSMMQAMTGNGTVTAQGIDSNAGIVALIAGLLGAALTFAESTGALRWDRGTQLLAAALSISIGAGAVVYALTTLGGPVGIGNGLALAILTGGPAVALAWRRLQQFGALRTSGRADA